ncbi:DUF3726 domain-containing protein [Sulfitobacter sp. F26204]|uniref:DUF3726 domain-containing protein n=1 Tax=Sulfitobacter sp. F26204 TaxID=2996014 RepID=UPI00225E5E4E|nr:DUF3726 domain-containing protein [Sulfitobacter sp. F26204]MCX7561301.1 DUF3726 domain-containing protein [Sulfitobacter sp. F26204]
MNTNPEDQTRGDSTPFFHGDEPAPLSCNETASLCMKAARGAGMSWGMAEEAGFASAWLVAHCIDGPSCLYAHLERADGKVWGDLCPTITPTSWRNTADHAICPIILGATICDYADLPEGPRPDTTIQLGRVSMPILLVPFLAVLARKNALGITLKWADSSICINHDETWLEAAARHLTVQQLDLTLSVKAGQVQKANNQTALKSRTTAGTIAALNTLAMRTTVPASDASRSSAGSTLSDND